MATDQLSLFGDKPSNSISQKFPKLKNCIEIIQMAPEEYKNNFKSLTIQYTFGECIFGNVIVGSTSKGVCYLAFEENRETAFLDLKKRYPKANFIEQTNELHQKALAVFANKLGDLEKVQLHIKGTDFQLQVWHNLLEIPFGELANYRDIAEKIGGIELARPVGTAVGKNPVAYLIPCHRVVPLSGKVGGYRWGPKRKTRIIQWERSQLNTNS